MGKRKVKATILECDNCGSTQVVTDDDVPLGITIQKGFWDLSGEGGSIREVFACDVDCIQGAVEKGMYSDG